MISQKFQELTTLTKKEFFRLKIFLKLLYVYMSLLWTLFFSPYFQSIWLYLFDEIQNFLNFYIFQKELTFVNTSHKKSRITKDFAFLKINKILK